MPVGINGDNYDRYYVRMREMDESVYMIRQLMEMLPDGPINVDDRRCTLPEKRLVYTEIESLINHFKLIMDGPARACRRGLRGARSAQRRARLLPREHGRRDALQAARARRRASCTWAACTVCWKAIQLADMIPTFGSVNMIGGECDR